MDSGAVVTNGTDAPVQDVDPLPSFTATVTRRLKNGSTFYPNQKMTRMEALNSYTIQNAFAAFEEKSKGSLEAGKEATLFICDGPIFDLRANVKRMWIAGKEVSLESRHTRLYERYRNRPK